MELLISLKDRGKIVYAKPSGSEWGREECLNKFIVVQVDTDKTRRELTATVEIEDYPYEKDKYYFDVDNAFAQSEWDAMETSDWAVFQKSSSFIKEN